jgi:hypothetical protein
LTKSLADSIVLQNKANRNRRALESHPTENSLGRRAKRENLAETGFTLITLAMFFIAKVFGRDDLYRPRCSVSSESKPRYLKDADRGVFFMFFC